MWHVPEGSLASVPELLICVYVRVCVISIYTTQMQDAYDKRTALAYLNAKLEVLYIKLWGFRTGRTL